MNTTVERTQRRLPGQVTTCESCGAGIVFARTLPGQKKGSGGRLMPLDVVESPAGNVAARPVTGTQLVARVLKKDETHDYPLEYLAMPHFATCTRRQAGPPQLPSNLRTHPARDRRGRRR